MNSRATFPVLILLALAAGAIPPVMRPWICDDAFITLRYVQNACEGLGLVYNPGEHVEGYTHFLWTILIWFFARFGLDPVLVATWLSVPFYIGILGMLLRASRALWPTPVPARGRAMAWMALPVASCIWALHRDALVFATSGLETSAYTCCLLLGFILITTSASARGRHAGIVSYGLAALLRPEGLIHLGLGLVAIAPGGLRAAPGNVTGRAGRKTDDRTHEAATPSRKDLSEFTRASAIAFVLVAPLYVWRLLYYHDVLPNAFYAKSAGLAYWSQGWFYVGLYFRYYAALGIAAVIGMLWVVRAKTRGPLVLAMAHALVILLMTAYVGGDFMFARFLLPATPFLALLAEHAVRSQKRWSLAWAALVILATFAGGIWRERTLRWPAMPRGVTDERSVYPPEDVAARRMHGARIAACFDSTDASFLVLSAQAALAYFARYPVAIEVNGLTDRTLARQPITTRGRPGHERKPTAEYFQERGIHFMVVHRHVAQQRQYAWIRFGGLDGEIITYDRALMEQVRRRCRDVEFVDFPQYLDDYIRRAPGLAVDVLGRDLAQYRAYYFAHNQDPDRLAQLQAILRQKQGH
ncbi:MAG TPA: hypothetical protein VFD07_00870 [Candidatus Krumholzibacteria bacterium]|nr:hypothetical protein [Candidatus Krumholzibacteria bacterium]